MRQVFLCDFSQHYSLGDSYAMVRFTPKQFEELLKLKKEADTDDDKYEDLSEKIALIEKEQNVQMFGLENVPYREMFGKKSPKAVISILKQSKTVSGEWEEGSFAFATTHKKAQDAVRKIEAKHVSDDWL